jgi:hypothetical protein
MLSAKNRCHFFAAGATQVWAYTPNGSSASVSIVQRPDGGLSFQCDKKSLDLQASDLKTARCKLDAMVEDLAGTRRSTPEGASRPVTISRGPDKKLTAEVSVKPIALNTIDMPAATKTISA